MNYTDGLLRELIAVNRAILAHLQYDTDRAAAAAIQDSRKTLEELAQVQAQLVESQRSLGALLFGQQSDRVGGGR